MSVRESRQIVIDTLKGASLPVPFETLLLIPLQQPGRLLNIDDPSRWTRLIEACCQSANGLVDLVPRVAAAFEVCIAALDVLDEVEDGDASALIDIAGVSRSINVSTSLLSLSHLILSAITEQTLVPTLESQLHHAMSASVMAATVGQDLDLQSEEHLVTDVNVALQVARQKSGSLGAGACHMGALLGTQDDRILEVYRQFGHHFGTMSQIANDIHDQDVPDIKTDVSRNKPTLPNIYRRNFETSESTKSGHDELEETGSLHFAWVVFETERLRCQEIIARLRNLGHDADHLQRLLDD